MSTFVAMKHVFITMIINQRAIQFLLPRRKYFLKFLRISNTILYGDHSDNFKSHNKNVVPENTLESNIKMLYINVDQNTDC